jgi:hypothetical protein
MRPTDRRSIWKAGASVGFVHHQIREIEDARQKRLKQEPETGPRAMVRHLARVEQFAP